jgi:threonine/homoserine/homoserine lactone efflux protein
MTTSTGNVIGCFLKGAIIGLSIAAPVGPIGVLCIRRSLVNGARIGFSTGLGAATADAIYGAVAGFGLTAIAEFLGRQQFWLGLVGGGFLCYLGLRTFVSRPASEAATARGDNALAAYASTFILTLTNPATILSFIAVFASFGIGSSTNYAPATALVVGVFIGSALWWLFLSTTVELLRSRFNSKWLRLVNQISGLIMFAFGIYTLTRGR